MMESDEEYDVKGVYTILHIRDGICDEHLWHFLKQIIGTTDLQ